MTEYVGGPYVLEPCHDGFGYSGKLPRVKGWDVRLDGMYVTSTGELKESLTGSFTCRLLSRAKEIAWQHYEKWAAEDRAINEEVLKLGREQPLEPERARSLYRKVLTAVGMPADQLDGKLEEIMKARKG